jgi:hypothetical protein
MFLAGYPYIILCDYIPFSDIAQSKKVFSRYLLRIPAILFVENKRPSSEATPKHL